MLSKMILSGVPIEELLFSLLHMREVDEEYSAISINFMVLTEARNGVSRCNTGFQRDFANVLRW